MGKMFWNLYGGCFCFDVFCLILSFIKNFFWICLIFWFYYWCFEFFWCYCYFLWRWCLFCYLWRCRSCLKMFWRIEKICFIIFFWRIRKFCVLCGMEFCYIFYWDGFFFLVCVNFRVWFGLRWLNSFFNFFLF